MVVAARRQRQSCTCPRLCTIHSAGLFPRRRVACRPSIATRWRRAVGLWQARAALSCSPARDRRTGHGRPTNRSRRAVPSASQPTPTSSRDLSGAPMERPTRLLTTGAEPKSDADRALRARGPDPRRQRRADQRDRGPFRSRRAQITEGADPGRQNAARTRASCADVLPALHGRHRQGGSGPRLPQRRGTVFSARLSGYDPERAGPPAGGRTRRSRVDPGPQVICRPTTPSPGFDAGSPKQT